VPVGAQSVRLDADRARRTLLFRRSFDLDAVPLSVPARMTADSRYVLSVNGVEVSRGPVRANPQMLRYDETDLAPHLRVGSNVIGAVVCFYGRATPWWRPVSPTWGLGGGSFLFEADLDGDLVVSDESWRVHLPARADEHDESVLAALPVEIVDGQDVPAGWSEAGFDDDGWSSAGELAVHHVGFGGSHVPPTHPLGPLLPRPIAALTAATREPAHLALWTGRGGGPEDDPVRQVEQDDRQVAPARLDLTPDALPLAVEAPGPGVAVVHVDFGEVVAGTVVVEVDGPAGATIDALFAERVDDDGTLRRDEQHAGFRYRTRSGPDRFETFDPIGFRYAGLSIRSDAPVVLSKVSVTERLHPRPSGPYFRCSDARLNDIWTAGRRTVDLCSFDAYLDCPTREQRAWTGDAVVHQMVDLASNPNWGLARWHVEMTGGTARADGMLPMAVAGDVDAADFTVLPDWALHWVRSLHNLWRYTGDRELVLALLPTAERVVRWFLPFQDGRGLLDDVNGWVLIDWAAVSTTGTSSTLNALWARALRDVEEMATWLGDEGRAGWAAARYAEVAAGFDQFWDEDRQAYVDHLVGSEAPISQHANAAAVAAGLVPDERHPVVVDLLVDRDRRVHASWLRPGRDLARPDEDAMYDGITYLFTGQPSPWWDVRRQVVAAQPFFRYAVHDALAEAGRADLVADQCRDWTRLLDRCDTTLSETWFGGTHCHGWSATPTRDLVTRTVGIEPAAPGWSRARVAPRLGDLAWAEAAAPTPDGLLTVRAEPGRIEIDSPVAVDIDRGGGAVESRPPGRHVIP
jgi:hypothetical protein